MVKRAYKISEKDKTTTVFSGGYKGIKNELSSLNVLEKSMVSRILYRIYGYGDNSMWESDDCAFKAEAKCEDIDPYDENTGMEICRLKTDLKYNKAMYNRYVNIYWVLSMLKIKIEKFMKLHQEKVERLERDLDQYQK